MPQQTANKKIITSLTMVKAKERHGKFATLSHYHDLRFCSFIKVTSISIMLITTLLKLVFETTSCDEKKVWFFLLIGAVC